MNSSLFLASMIGDTASKFGVDWPHLIAQMVSFLIVAALLHRFAYKPILTTLAARKQRIAESLANADKIKAQLAEAEESRKKTLAEAGAQATKIIEEARAAAQREMDKRSQEAIATAQQIIEKARQSSEAELVRMKLELKKEVGRLVVETTAKVTGKVLTMDDQHRLVDETNKQLVA